MFSLRLTRRTSIVATTRGTLMVARRPCLQFIAFIAHAHIFAHHSILEHVYFLANERTLAQKLCPESVRRWRRHEDGLLT